ncbi:uncharacterized protein BO95DRAFT_439788 [Aspergillus brunneoviolaceus CBS 621.78]|uniref:Uncharacterized protein n=1 Tax=Aspergillus brunneoviolaceus CBS 621.78 TaxID=1450534 RepID=A0ACD1GIS3_9EURO|nr:hypothetical protein BO95DRAFT_439788 [Aspergillus brunneoviolaceus CBS 621.78]RAH49072.1 hypothetical protein BO95DRAFT_439788 [Aspergillus brunneoviolaceus CBS 621.78]
MFRRKSRSYLLDVVVAQGAAILELLTSEDETLLIRGDTLLILDLGLDVVDGVARLDVEGNGLTREGLDETMEFEKNHWSANCSLPLLEFPPPCHFPKVFPVSSPFFEIEWRCMALGSIRDGFKTFALGKTYICMAAVFVVAG